jgi:hypothetical protein
MVTPLVSANGIDGETGEYLTPPMPAEQLVATLMGSDLYAELKGQEPALRIARQSQVDHLGPPAGTDAANLASAGWGVIFASNADPAIREALSSLLDLRAQQAGNRYKEFSGEQGFQVGRTPEESYTTFLARAGVGFGAPRPSKVPYYLLIVGDPEAIPYRFQQLLDTQYAVGRIHFDTLDAYVHYARSVVEAERRPPQRRRRLVLAGAHNPGDPSTEASATVLLPELGKALAESDATAGWNIEHWEPERAHQAHLLQLLGGAETPALSFIACHGLSFRGNRQRQRHEQGALLCQDWPGRQAWGAQPIPPEFYLAADDIRPEAALQGSIAFLFACFGAGTPRHDEYAHGKQLGWRETVAPQAMVSALPQRLLGHPNGGALAVIGHVDQIWTHSFTNRHSTNAQSFADVLIWLMSGARVGYAMEALSLRWAEVGGVLNNELEDIRFGKRPDPQTLVDLWTTHNDARGYILLGDPAVRLTFDDQADGAPQA